jgi:hypothetical protein
LLYAGGVPQKVNGICKAQHSEKPSVQVWFFSKKASGAITAGNKKYKKMSRLDRDLPRNKHLEERHGDRAATPVIKSLENSPFLPDA